MVSTAASVTGKLPQPTFNVNQLTSIFASVGLSFNDMIALSGILISYFETELLVMYNLEKS